MIRALLARLRRKRPTIEALARAAHRAVSEIDAAEGRPVYEWGDLHASNRARYKAIGRAVAEKASIRPQERSERV